MTVIWHDLECGAYTADVPLWRSLAAACGEPLLEVGAGTGRVALDLAGRGHRVWALDVDRALLSELARRASDLAIRTVLADAREFDLEERFGLIAVPMQTIQLLGGAEGRRRFLERARLHLAEGGLVAIAISDSLELFAVGDGGPAPLPDVRELDGVVYCSQPTAVRAVDDGFLLKRTRETVRADGERTVEDDVIKLDRLSAAHLEAEAAALGLRAAGRALVPATSEHAGSIVVMLRG
jgi:SAM-dependent methyltransferase